jgi:signal peptidase I
VIGKALGLLGAVVGAAIVVVLIVFFFVARHYRVPSSAMEPTLHCARPETGCLAKHQDRFVVFTFLGFGRGDLVVFETPPAAEARCGAGGVYVKRIVGEPGDVWEERNGVVYVNRRKLDEPYLERDRRDSQSFPRVRLSPDQFYLLGDNRAASCDSRVFGPVDRELIIGKAYAIYWPPKRIGFL